MPTTFSTNDVQPTTTTRLSRGVRKFIKPFPHHILDPTQQARLFVQFRALTLPVTHPHLLEMTRSSKRTRLRLRMAALRRFLSPFPRTLFQNTLRFMLPSATCDPNSWHRYHFRRDKPLGRGAFGTVHSAMPARSAGLPARVALKTTFDPPWKRYRLTHAEFKLETNAHELVSMHPHIATLYAGRVRRHATWLAMQLLDGGSVHEALLDVRQFYGRNGFGERVAVRIALQAADALAFMHLQGVAHRDIKPGNMLLRASILSTLKHLEDANNLPRPAYTCWCEETESPICSQEEKEKKEGVLYVCVSDFGLARFFDPVYVATAISGSRAGTEPYRSPQQDLHARHDVRKGDVFALGVSLYEMVCGHRPFWTASCHETRGDVEDEAVQLALRKKKGPQFYESAWMFAGEGIKSVLRALLTGEEQRRPCMDMAFEMLKVLDRSFEPLGEVIHDISPSQMPEPYSI